MEKNSLKCEKPLPPIGHGFKLDNGATTHLYRLNNPRIEDVARVSVEIDRKGKWRFGIPADEWNKHFVLEINLAGENIYLIYDSATKRRWLTKTIKQRPEHTVNCLIAAVYRGTFYSCLSNHNAKMVLAAVMQNIPLGISALITKNED
jgi:hypothetical protein